MSVGGVPWDFTQQLLPSDWELFREILEGAIRRVPVLAEAELAHLSTAPEGITPDSRPSSGPSPACPVLARAGLSHTGFGAGGAIGHILAQCSSTAEPPYDVTELSARRFGPCTRIARTRGAGRESYSTTTRCAIPTTRTSWVAGPTLGPLDARLAESGAVFREKKAGSASTTSSPACPAAARGRTSADGAGDAGLLRACGRGAPGVRERAGLFDFTSSASST